MPDTADSQLGHETWILQPLRVDGVSGIIDVDEKGVTFGRDESNTVVLSRKLYPGVSGHHSLVVIRDGNCVIEDLGSKNHTYVAGKKVERVVLKHGDVIQLGHGGPRFTALSAMGAGSETMEIPRSALETQIGKRSIGTETIMEVRQKLGIPEGENVEDLVASRSNKNIRLFIVGVLVLAAAGGLAYYYISSKSKTDIKRLEGELETASKKQRELEEAFTRQLKEQKTSWAQANDRIDLAEESFGAEKERLQEEGARIQKEMAELQAGDKAAEEKVRVLRAQLDRNQESLRLYNPITLEEHRLQRVAAVERSVVLVDAKVRYRRMGTSEYLYIDENDDKELDWNFEGRGKLLELPSTGSGVCITKDGWILTNAHCVFKKGEDWIGGAETIRLEDGVVVEREIDLATVFSGNSARHTARLVDWAADDWEDLALLKIEPFEGMPSLESLDLNAQAPPISSDVYLIGFPLGRQVLQEGEKVIASTFKGVFSRRVDHFLQVDAAVHPGQSGGPAIDAQGNVIGVVVAMETTDKEAVTSNIGYIIPIAAASKIWPPPSPDGVNDG